MAQERCAFCLRRWGTRTWATLPPNQKRPKRLRIEIWVVGLAKGGSQPLSPNRGVRNARHTSRRPQLSMGEHDFAHLRDVLVGFSVWKGLGGRGKFSRKPRPLRDELCLAGIIFAKKLDGKRPSGSAQRAKSMASRSDTPEAHAMPERLRMGG